MKKISVSILVVIQALFANVSFANTNGWNADRILIAGYYINPKIPISFQCKLINSGLLSDSYTQLRMTATYADSETSKPYQHESFPIAYWGTGLLNGTDGYSICEIVREKILVVFENARVNQKLILVNFEEKGVENFFSVSDTIHKVVLKNNIASIDKVLAKKQKYPSLDRGTYYINPANILFFYTCTYNSDNFSTLRLYDSVFGSHQPTIVDDFSNDTKKAGKCIRRGTEYVNKLNKYANEARTNNRLIYFNNTDSKYFPYNPSVNTVYIKTNILNSYDVMATYFPEIR